MSRARGAAWPGVEVRPGPRGTVYRAAVKVGERRLRRTFRTPEAALAWRAEVLGAVSEGRALPAPLVPPVLPASVTATVEDACRALARGMVAGTVRTRTGQPFKPSVVRKYESMLRLYALPPLGRAPLAGLRKRDVQRWVDDLAAERGPETARKALTALRVALRVAERDGLIDASPCAGVRVPQAANGERAVRVLTPEECAAIVSAADADDARLGRSLAGPLFALLFGSGLRLGEARALVWGPGGLDLAAGCVRVRASLDTVRGDDGEFARHGPKSRAGVRDVPIPAPLVARLRRHRLAAGRPEDGALVFCDADARGLYGSGFVRRAWVRIVRATGIEAPWPRLHDARHAWAVAMLRAGLRAEALAALGGWSDTAMVTRRYGRHALPEELSEAGTRLGDYLAGRGL